MANTIFFISNFRRVLNVIFFLLGDSLASEFYVQTFRNTMFHLHRWCKREGLTQCSETSAYNIQTPGNHPKERIQQTQYCLTDLVRNKCFCMISYLSIHYDVSTAEVMERQMKYRSHCRDAKKVPERTLTPAHPEDLTV